MVISRKPLHFIVAMLISVLPMFSMANSSDSNAENAEVSHSEEPKELKTEIKEFIDHHLMDAYDFHLFSWQDDSGKDHHVGFPLPVILIDNGIQFFCLQNSIMVKMWQKATEIFINYTTVKFIKRMQKEPFLMMKNIM
jgi:hypothetical protein